MIKINLLENSKGKNKRAGGGPDHPCQRWKWATWVRPN